MQGIDELAPVLGVKAACRALGVPRSSYYRLQRPPAPPRLRVSRTFRSNISDRCSETPTTRRDSSR